MTITVKGLEPLRAQIDKLARMTNEIGDDHGYVGTRLPYGFGIETGRHRQSGKLARAAGGAQYLQRAMDEVLVGASADIEAGMAITGGPGPWIVKRLGRWMRRLARVYAPEGPASGAGAPGRLRHSILFESGRG